MPKRVIVTRPTLNEAQEELLIQQVKENSILYDISHEKYLNTKEKSKVWGKISEILNEEKEIVKQAWISIKNKFKREHKKTQLFSGAGADEIYKPNWVHYESLQFLSDSTLPIETTSNLDSIFESTSSINIRDVNTPNNYKFPPRSVRESPQVMTTPRKSSNIINDGTFSSDSHENNEQEDMTFFASLVEHVKKVRKEDKLRMRNEIHEVVNKYAYPQLPKESVSNYDEQNRYYESFNATHRYYNPQRFPSVNRSYNYHRLRDEGRYHPISIETPKIKRERDEEIYARTSVKLDRQDRYGNDDSDCEIVGESKLVKMAVKREKKNEVILSDKTNKQNFMTTGKDNESPANVIPIISQLNLLQQNQFYEQLIKQQMGFMNFQNPALQPNSFVTLPNGIVASTSIPQTKVVPPEDKDKNAFPDNKEN